jgi:hypothetical protein
MFAAVRCSGAGRRWAGQVLGAEHLVPVLGDENHVGMLDKTQFRKICFASMNVTEIGHETN